MDIIRNKDISLIPKGIYCYGEGRKDKCPYWKKIEVEKNLFIYHCDYLDLDDYGNCTEEEYNRFIELYGKEKMDNFCCLLLLWDQVKECGINEEYEDD